MVEHNVAVLVDNVLFGMCRCTIGIALLIFRATVICRARSFGWLIPPMVGSASSLSSGGCLCCSFCCCTCRGGVGVGVGASAGVGGLWMQSLAYLYIATDTKLWWLLYQ
jgi:hypothetical protein